MKFNCKGVIKKFALYIPRLLAGKLEEICPAFPLATFLAKNLRGYTFARKKRNIYKYSRVFDCKAKNRSKDSDFISENAKIW